MNWNSSRGDGGAGGGAGLRVLYNRLLLPSARALLPAAGLVDSKLAAFSRARKNWRNGLAAELSRRPDVTAGNALWVHAASAGEFLQAQALLAALRSALPAAPLVSTYTSPSVLPLLDSATGADLVFPLPLDTLSNARAWLDTVRPAAAAFIDAEIWPNFVSESAGRGIPLALVSARLGEDSRRLRFPARGLYRGLYRAFRFVGAVDEVTAGRLRRAGAPSDRVAVTGDLRVDETLRRAQTAGRELRPPLPRDVPVMVAGSTWPDDEAVLLPALAALRGRGLSLSLVVAPHDVSEPRLKQLEGSLEAVGFASARWSAAGSPQPDRTVDALVINRVGLLHRLYAHAAAAYVGGGFRGALHNVMEPAAFAAPVVTGPRTRRSWLAGELIRAGALLPVADISACTAALGHLLSNAPAGTAAGRRAFEVLARHSGAAERTLAGLRQAGWLPQEEVAAATSPKKSSGGTASS